MCIHTHIYIYIYIYIIMCIEAGLVAPDSETLKTDLSSRVEV